MEVVAGGWQLVGVRSSPKIDEYSCTELAGVESVVILPPTPTSSRADRMMRSRRGMASALTNDIKLHVAQVTRPRKRTARTALAAVDATTTLLDIPHQHTK